MVHHPYLSKSIYDASWGMFERYLIYKAEEAGCKVVKVDPRGTSQKCSQCKNKVKKTLAQRWYRCQNCGLSLDRDVNSARNIILSKSATDGLSGCNARGGKSSSVESQISFPSKREA